MAETKSSKYDVLGRACYDTERVIIDREFFKKMFSDDWAQIKKHITWLDKCTGKGDETRPVFHCIRKENENIYSTNGFILANWKLNRGSEFTKLINQLIPDGLWRMRASTGDLIILENMAESLGLSNYPKVRGIFDSFFKSKLISLTESPEPKMISAFIDPMLVFPSLSIFKARSMQMFVANDGILFEFGASPMDFWDDNDDAYGWYGRNFLFVMGLHSGSKQTESGEKTSSNFMFDISTIKPDFIFNSEK